MLNSTAQIGHRTATSKFDVRELRAPMGNLRRKIANRRKIDMRILGRDIHHHLVDVVRVVVPTILANDCQHRHIDLGRTRLQMQIGKAHTTRRNRQPIGRHIVKAYSTALAKRYFVQSQRNRVAIEQEIAPHNISIVELHCRPINSATVAMSSVVTEKFESEIGDLGTIDRHREITALARAQTFDHLLDIDLTIGHFGQAQQRAIDLRHTKCQRFESGDSRFDLTRIQQRITLIILDIETLDLQSVEQPQIDVFDAHLSTQLTRSKARSGIDDPVLHRPDIDQHRQRQRKNYRHQNKCRYDITQYFYTFAH